MKRLERPLTRNQLKKMLRQFKREYGDIYQLTELGFFGSYARETEGPESDVDVVYQMHKSARPNLFQIVRLREHLVAWLQCPVDVIEYRDHMPPKLKARIGKEAVYV